MPDCAAPAGHDFVRTRKDVSAVYNIKIENATNQNSLNFSPTENLVITNVDGLTGGSVSFSTSQGFGQTGTTLTGLSVQARTITIDGAFLGLSTDLRKRLIDTIVPDMELKIIFNNKLFVNGYAKEWPEVSRDRYGAEFQFIIYVPYPYWRELEQAYISLAGIEARFIFPFNTGDPSVPDYHVLGMRTEERYINIYNEYNVPIPFKVIFYAKTSVTNPRIENMKTLKYIRMQREMVPGETIIIDMTGQSPVITSDAIGTDPDAFGYYDIDSTMFKLQVGENFIKYGADVNEDGLWVTVIYYPTTTGAAGNDLVYM